MAEEREFGWDDEIENDSEFQILPDGDYNFTVTGFERGRHQGSAKLPPCNKAIITLNVADGKGNQGTIKHNLFLHTKTEGMLCAFFTALGAIKRPLKKELFKLKFAPRFFPIPGAVKRSATI